MKQLFHCPTCKLEVNRGAGFFPFCCERCRIIDLGRWSDGSYAIAAEPVGFDEADQNGIEPEERVH